MFIMNPVLVLAQAHGEEGHVHVEGDEHTHEEEETLQDIEAGTLKEEVDDLNKEVEDRERRIKELDNLVGRFRSRITEQESAQVSLQNTVMLIENRIQEKQLATERTKQQIELTNIEIQRLGNQIRVEEAKINRRQESLAELIRQIHEAESVSVYDVLVTRKSISEFFAHVNELRRLEQDLSEATKLVKQAKAELESKKKDQEARRLTLQDLKRSLEQEKVKLEEEKTAKLSILEQSLNQENEFRKILYELRQEQQTTNDDIAELENRIKDKLDSVDQALARGDVLLSWPVNPTRGISARFHDNTYPFKHLFEHPGIDLPVNVGTPVKTAAGGYVAFTRTGKQYGNYVMIIHPGGVATIYAHLSKFNVETDQYVERGEVIGYSGGRPGMQGAGLSTGPHLHFEVRQNGIPTDPMQFLPSLD